MSSAPDTSAETRYNQLKSNRNEAISRAKKCANLTVPYLFKEVTKGKSPSNRKTPYQGTGARCVNTLSARILLALFPPNASFFRLSPDGIQAGQLAEAAGIAHGELEAGLAEIERTVINDIETSGMRARLSATIKHLVGVGNGLLFIPDEGNAKFYPLSRYVVDRDGMGSLLELITLDTVSPDTLDEGLRTHLKIDSSDKTKEGAAEDVDLYTRVALKEGIWQVYQEVNGVMVPDSDGSYPKDACPWIPLRIPEVDGEDYGAGLVQDYFGDFDALEKLTKALLKGAAAAAKVLWALDENATITPRKITAAESGDVLRFKASQLSAVRQDKYSDFSFVVNYTNELKRNLESAFGVRTSVQRDAERVTAEEIRYLAQELESTLGGIYSILAEDLLLPLVRRIMHRLTKSHRLPPLPEGILKPRIVVGVAALGRGQDMRKLSQWAMGVREAIGEQAFSKRVNDEELMYRMGAAEDISMKGLIRTEEELQAEQERDTAHQSIQRAAPQVAQAAIQGGGNAP